MALLFARVCRACLSEGEHFSYKLGENVSTDLYMYCTTVKVYNYEDGLPRTLCDLCYENLKKYSEFKRTCIESQNILYHNNMTMKDELSCSVGINNDHKSLEDLCSTIIKTEDVFDCDDDTFEIKNEDLSKSIGSNLNVVKEFHDDKLATIEKKIKKRKAKKLEKQKEQSKPKLKIRKNKFSYTCEICRKKFKYLERYEAHKLEHEGKSVSIHCLPCNKTFMTWSGLRRHNETDHTIVCLDKLKCTTCGKIFRSQQTLKMHEKTHGERIVYVCDVCGKGFTTKFILKAHLEIHKENRERLFTCEHCGKKFYTNTILLSHVSRRHTDRRFICQICSYPFTDKYNLAKHLLNHDGKKLFKCEICTKSYSTQSSLVEHKRIHSGERPYVCTECSKSFLSKRRLDDHHKTHTGEKPHKCNVCGQSFTQRGTLKRHMKVHDTIIHCTNPQC